LPKWDIFSAKKFKETLSEAAQETTKNTNIYEVKMFKECESILVCSGDYKPEWDETMHYFIDDSSSMSKPDATMANLKEALEFIFKQIKT
jgi:hypothetical protein